MQVNYTKRVYTHGFTVQKEHICMHILSQEEKCVWDEKLRKLRWKNTKGQYHGIIRQYSVE